MSTKRPWFLLGWDGWAICAYIVRSGVAPWEERDRNSSLITGRLRVWNLPDGLSRPHHYQIAKGSEAPEREFSVSVNGDQTDRLSFAPKVRHERGVVLGLWERLTEHPSWHLQKVDTQHTTFHPPLFQPQIDSKSLAQKGQTGQANAYTSLPHHTSLHRAKN